MAAAIGQFSNAGGSGTSTTNTGGPITPTGSPPNLICAFANDHTNTLVSVGPDSAGNKYTLVNTSTHGAIQLYVYASQAFNGGSAGGSTSGGTNITIPVKFTNNADATILFFEVTGAPTASTMFDTAVTAFGSSTTSPYSITSGTPTASGELGLFFGAPDPTNNASGDTWTPTSGWTSKYYQPDGDDFWAIGLAYETMGSSAVTVGASYSDSTVTWAANAVLGIITASGGGTSKTLTGVSGTASVGTITPAVAKALTGNSGTAGVGTVKPQATYTVTGVAGTSSVGTVTYAIGLSLAGLTSFGAVRSPAPNISPPNLPGTTGTASVGAITYSVGPTLGGVSGTAAVGTLAPAIATTLSSQSSTGTAGTVTVGGQTTFNLTGVSGVTSVGNITSSVASGLLGVSATSGVGSITQATGLVLPGLVATATVAGVSPGVSYGLVGVSATSSVGTIVPTSSGGGTMYTLGGVTATGQVGAPGVNVSYTLAGVVAHGTVGAVVQSGGTPVTSPDLAVAAWPSVSGYKSIAQKYIANIPF